MPFARGGRNQRKKLAFRPWLGELLEPRLVPANPTTPSDTNILVNQVTEGSLAGQPVGITVVSSDPDSAGPVLYSLTDNAGGRFAINSNTGIVTVANAGLIDFESAISHTITVRATDANLEIASNNFIVEVRDSPPSINDIDAAFNILAEGSPAGSTVGVTIQAGDPNGPATPFTLTNNAGGRFALDTNTGLVTVADASLINFETGTSHTIAVQTSDGVGGAITRSFTISVSNVGPSAPIDNNSGVNEVLEGSPVGTTVGLTVLSTEPNGPGPFFSLTGNAGGRFAINNTTGVVAVANSALLDFESATSHTITVQVRDGAGATASQSYVIQVLNAAPGLPIDTNQATNAAVEGVANGSTVGITIAALDPSGSNVSFSLTDNAGGRFAIHSSTGVVTVANGSLLNFETAGSHSIVVQASDGVNIATQTFAVLVNNVLPTAPVDVDAANNLVLVSAANGSPVGITAASTDVNGPAVQFSLTNDAGGRFAINSSTGVVTVANSAILGVGSVSIVVQARDGGGGTSQTGFNIDVIGSNLAPTAPIDQDAVNNQISVSAATGGLTGITAFSTDADGPAPLSYSLTNNAGGRFTINTSTGVVTIANAALLTVGNHTVTVEAKDGAGASANGTFTIAVLAGTNAAPTTPTDANSSANQVVEGAVNGTSVSITVAATDADGPGPLFFDLTNNAGGRFAIDANTGVVTVANGALLDFESATSHVIGVRVRDGLNAASTTSLTVTVTNAAPSVPSDVNNADNRVSEGAAFGTAAGVIASSADVNGPAVTYSLTNDAGGRFQINGTTGVVTVANAALLNFESAGSHSITVQARDSAGATATQNFTIDVANVNPATPADGDPSSNLVAEGSGTGTLVGLTGASTDVNGPNVTYALADNAGGRFQINSTTGVVTVLNGSLLNFETAASHQIAIQVSDGQGGSAQQSFTVQLSNVIPSAPIDADPDGNLVSDTAANGTAVGITAQASDVNGPTISYSLTDHAGGRFAINSSTGVVTVANNTLLNAQTSSQHSITVQSSDGSGTGTAQASFAIRLRTGNNQLPTTPLDANADANQVTEGAINGALVGITAAASDSDGPGSLTYSLLDNAGGRFAINSSTGVVTVANAALINFETGTSHQVTVQVRDGLDGGFPQAFSIQVLNALPTVPNDIDAADNAVTEGAGNGTNVGIAVTSTDPNTSVVFSLTNSANGRFAINASTGIVTVANAGLINFETAGSHSITIQASDGGGGITTATFTVNVNNAGPSVPSDANAANNTVAEGAAIGTAVGITASATDPNGPALSYSLTDNAGGRFQINSTTGIVTVANGTLLDFEAAQSHSIAIQAHDGAGGVNSQIFNINVSNIAPTTPTDSNAAVNLTHEPDANGSPVGLTASSTDPGATPLSYSLSNSAGGRFAINSVTGVVTLADRTLLNAASASSHVVNVVATDGFTSANQSFLINVQSGINQPPTTPIDQNINPNVVVEGAANGSTVGLAIQTSDTDGPGPIAASLTNSAGGRFALNTTTGVVTVANSALINFETAASHVVTVEINDGGGGVSSQSFVIDVTNVAPTITANNVPATSNPNETVNLSATATEINNDPLTFTWNVAGPEGVQFALTGANASFVPGKLGNYLVQLQVSDGTAVVNAAAKTVVVSYSDNFNRGNSTNLGPAWQETRGDSAIVNNRLEGVATPSNLKLAGVSNKNVVITFDGAVGNGSYDYALAVARQQNPVNFTNTYIGGIFGHSGNFKAQVWGQINDVWVLLGSSPLGKNHGAVRMEVFEDSLRLLIDNQLHVNIAATHITLSGAAGLLISQGSTADNFRAEGLEYANHAADRNFSQPINNLPAGTTFGNDFRLNSGHYISNGSAMIGQNSVNVATVSGYSRTNVAAQASFSLPVRANAYAGVVARYTGPVENNFYFACIVHRNGVFRAEAYANVNGNYTFLGASAPLANGNVPLSANLLFEVEGNLLRVLVNNNQVLQITDNRITGPGSAGIIGNMQCAITSFNVFNQVPTPVTDAFTGNNGDSLSADWAPTVGGYQIQDNRARGLAPDLNVALFTGVLQSNVDLRANVDGTAAGFIHAGLVARYSGAGDTNMYLGAIAKEAGVFQAQIWRNLNGTWVKLVSTPLASGVGLLRFQLQGTTLRLFFEGTQVLTVVDSALSIGFVGIRSDNVATLDNFQVS